MGRYPFPILIPIPILATRLPQPCLQLMTFWTPLIRLIH